MEEETVGFARKMGYKRLGVAMRLGHDTLFTRYCRAPMTVLSTKDRVTGHNPLAALYTSNSYYGHLKDPK
jgi:uncharacterized metal-binding protein